MTTSRIVGARLTRYQTFLHEKRSSRSMRDLSGALHSHCLMIRGITYTFVAEGERPWAFKSDTISFEFEVKNGYRVIKPRTFKTLDSSGHIVVRGGRGEHPDRAGRGERCDKRASRAKVSANRAPRRDRPPPGSHP